ncbi:cysteine hydrolase family protein [Chondromyces apiculatus]|uniref:Isochorismatase n=1 Tax=Chondromyces apiculatus DSM 436 TaxID=1192034 RepID=A0A017SVA0_9BACT|nr:cysteine hydrolase family protein [Chondromyces apiculatus]EYF00520.1 Isochorismatase [Chondromyces apiculatus DSM 436]
MADLHTLRSLNSFPAQPAPLRDSALVLIDCQNTYRSGVMQLEGVEAALVEARRLLDRARALGAPVIHIIHDFGAGSAFDIRAENGQISDIVAAQGDEPVITKHYPSSFEKTDLHERLSKLGVKDLVLIGFMTHMCVNSTARVAFNLGYRPTIVASATASRALPSPTGGVVPAQVVHEAALAAVGDLFAVVVPRGDALRDDK